jgi:hypothetical protein
MTKFKRLAALAAAAALAGATMAPPALAHDLHPPPPPPPGGEHPPSKSKCNSGNGNGSDQVTFVEGEHCFGGDPGNSYNAGNKGGDEIPTSGGVPNPGGNNVP